MLFYLSKLAVSFLVYSIVNQGATSPNKAIDSFQLISAKEQKKSGRLSVWFQGTGIKPYVQEASVGAALSFNAAVLGRLLFQTGAYSLEPGLLRSWKWDFQDESYVLQLQPNLKFHHGRAVTSSDLEFSLLRGIFSQRSNFFRTYFANVEGIEKIRPGEKFLSGAVSGVKILDPLRLRIKLRSPNPSFLHSLSNASFSLVPNEELKEDLLTWKTAPIGAGRYRVSDNRSSSSKVLLEKVNPLDPGPKEVLLSTEQIPEGDEDLLIGNFQPKEKSFQYQSILSKQADRITAIYFNFSSPLGSNSHFRKAIAYAIDRDSLLVGQTHLAPAFEHLPAHFWGRADFHLGYNLSIAKAELKKVGVQSQSLLNEKIVIPVRGQIELSPVFDRLSNQLKQLGLDICFEKSSTKFWEPKDHATGASVIALAMDDADPLVEFTVFQSQSPLAPFIPSLDPPFEKLVIAARQNYNMDDRINAVKRLSKYVIGHTFVVPLFEQKQRLNVRKDRVADLGLQDGGIHFYFDRVTMK